MKRDNLAFFQHIAPAMRRHKEYDHDTEAVSFAFPSRNAFSQAMIFDCRELPEQFIDDTGAAAIEEVEKLEQHVNLPYSCCYFEFSDDFAIFANTAIAHSEGQDPIRDPGNEIVEAFAVEGWNKNRDRFLETLEFKTYFLFPNDYSENADAMGVSQLYFDPDEDIEVEKMGVDDDGFGEKIGNRLLGVLTLLNEKFLATKFVPDPSPEINRKRGQNGKPPISGESHVLTLNLASIRRVSKRPTGTHESPRLHWRRGHERVLHRGSEFEAKTWVRRCLVGDPDLGFVSKDYRLVWNPSMLEA